MSTYVQLLAQMATVVGGTFQRTNPDGSGWYSGKDAGDSTGVAGLAGCYWPAPEIIQDTPAALIIPGNTKLMQPFPMQGHKQIEDTVHVRLMVGHSNLATMMLLVAAFHDLVPSVFDSHMFLGSSGTVVAANCDGPDWLEVEWGGSTYAALEFSVRIERILSVTYAG